MRGLSMRLRSFARPLFVLSLALGLALAPRTSAGQGTGFNPALPLTHVDNGPNSAWAQSQHYVVLVSLDGFRWDYAKRDNATHLLALGKHGVWAPEGMMPSYPSLTFPNHFTIVTGLYPEHTGIVANSFLDPARDARYSYTDPQAADDGSWYSGVPLVEPRREPGNAHRMPALGRLRSEDRRLPALLVRALTSKNEPTPESQQARIDDTVALLRLARCRSSALHHDLFLRARSLRATSSAPTRPKPALPRSRWMRSSASSNPR